MKKKIFCMIFITVIIITGCTQDEQLPLGSPGDLNWTINNNTIDIDLTAFSTTMAYSVMTDVFTNPDEYIGKVFKTNGVYEPYFFEATGREHSLITVEGPPGCCPKLLEVKWDGEFPEDFAEVQVTGVFGIYEEAGYVLPYLQVDTLTVLAI
jgi:hypothetical protein